MFGSPILDVALGMAFVYLLLSLIASAVQEILSAFVQSRAANLQRGLNSLFSGHSLNGVPLVEMLYKHGLVRGLYQDPSHDLAHSIGLVAHEITPRYSRLRLAVQRWVGISAPAGILPNLNPLLLPAYIPARTFALATIDILSNSHPVGDDPMPNVAAALRKAAEDDPDNKALEAIRTLFNDAAGSPARLQANLENWYNDAMDRVSGWYKHYTQRILIVLGLLLAIGFNVDTVRITRTLWFDREIRSGLVSAASGYLDSHSTTPPPAYPSANLTHRLTDTVNAFNQVSDARALPVGWAHSWWATRHTAAEYGSTLRDSFAPGPIKRGLQALTGWLLTAIALSLGAPFWFDTLNRFMVIRGTIKPQEKSQPEPSKH